MSAENHEIETQKMSKYIVTSTCHEARQLCGQFEGRQVFAGVEVELNQRQIDRLALLTEILHSKDGAVVCERPVFTVTPAQ